MPKPRLPQNIQLPSRWRFKHGGFYYRVPRGDEPKWGGRQDFLLGNTLDEAFDRFESIVLADDIRVDQPNLSNEEII